MYCITLFSLLKSKIKAHLKLFFNIFLEFGFKNFIYRKTLKISQKIVKIGRKKFYHCKDKTRMSYAFRHDKNKI